MVKVYIYGVLDDDENIIYVGKSATPKRRLVNHRMDSGYKKLVILEIIRDKEQDWIDKLLSEGHPLQNKERMIEQEDWEVGDVVEFNHKTAPIRVRHKPTGVIYESANKAGYAVYGTHSTFITNLKNSPKSKYHKDWEIV